MCHFLFSCCHHVSTWIAPSGRFSSREWQPHSIDPLLITWKKKWKRVLEMVSRVMFVMFTGSDRDLMTFRMWVSGRSKHSTGVLDNLVLVVSALLRCGLVEGVMGAVCPFNLLVLSGTCFFIYLFLPLSAVKCYGFVARKMVINDDVTPCNRLSLREKQLSRVLKYHLRILSSIIRETIKI